ncbi:hypothetical protein A3C67_00045 [Candidatus Nomurabacteria bacterium RIFCSPHIGHO2_02_FULL_42_19]|uniref:Uncharacterized protein n=1 Tax=Candidatus Nomurabacteria bacterium RIFCSPHIGHO2_02_FULL_42_19 TaxID=1801756 RepID=A0A1F6W3T2_9BACT|nr:MAG: hypothetical protein A3C67_00045 [Candidatus Nomurabacteria bacterium RIFCSPHIGHO2_02_FULL_42_19]
MLSQIPGHVRAYTWVIALVALASSIFTRQWHTGLGMILVVAGMFLGDQATHLSQENHAGMAATWIESEMQYHTRLFQCLGIVVVALGIWLAFHGEVRLPEWHVLESVGAGLMISVGVWIVGEPTIGLLFEGDNRSQNFTAAVTGVLSILVGIAFGTLYWFKAT